MLNSRLCKSEKLNPVHKVGVIGKVHYIKKIFGFGNYWEKYSGATQILRTEFRFLEERMLQFLKSF